VQCELDSDVNQVVQSPVGVERHSDSAAVSLVGLDEAPPASTDRLSSSEEIYLSRTNETETKLFYGWSLVDLHQAQ